MGRLAQLLFQRLIALSEMSLPRSIPEKTVLERPFPGTEKALAEMTLDEKMKLVGGFRSFAVAPVPRLGIPAVWMTDATSGIRLFGGGTAFPCALAMASTWNRNLIGDMAAALGKECRERNISLLLGPGVNICRVPTGGRNFEYFGEDPHLAGALAAVYILGLRSRGVEAVVKHFACNNSEYDRHRENAVVDTRTLRELYLPAFHAAVKDGGVRFVMTSYNQLNGTYASENEGLIKVLLRTELGFEGAVMSDWISTYSTVGAIEGGLDLEMPRAKRFAPGKIRRALKKGMIAPSDLDSMVRNILSACDRSGFYNQQRDESTDVPSSSETAYRIAAEGVVLLKNRDTLPLDRKAVRKILVTGSCARGTDTGGGGSSHVKPKGSVDILEGLRQAAGKGTEVIFLNRKRHLHKKDHSVIASADVVIACIGFDHTFESEGYDRQWEIPYGGGGLVREIAEVNPAVVTVLTGGGAMEMASWIDGAAAVLHSFYLGETVGRAVAGVLFGEVNPSGRLPVTVPRSPADVRAMEFYRRNPWDTSLLRFYGPQGVRGFRKVRDLVYSERLSVGYRGYRDDGNRPLFPFGFGLSYTDFEYSDLILEPVSCRISDIHAAGGVKVSVLVRNTGHISGMEVVQVYVGEVQPCLPRPYRELKGFSKVLLEPGEEKRVIIELKADSFSCFDETDGGWIIEPGEFRIMICRNAEEVLLESKVTLYEPAERTIHGT